MKVIPKFDFGLLAHSRTQSVISMETHVNRLLGLNVTQSIGFFPTVGLDCHVTVPLSYFCTFLQTLTGSLVASFTNKRNITRLNIAPSSVFSIIFEVLIRMMTSSLPILNFTLQLVPLTCLKSVCNEPPCRSKLLNLTYFTSFGHVQTSS